MIKLHKGNIVDLTQYDVMVNAANSSLLGGSGVDGAIHAAAGEELFKECITLLRCHTGEAKITGAYKLNPVKHIIHTVTPIYDEYEGRHEPRRSLMAACYVSTFVKLLNLNISDPSIRKIVFPSLGTGAHGWPINEAVEIAIIQTKSFLKIHGNFEVGFCLFSDHDLQVYENLLAKYDQLYEY